LKGNLTLFSVLKKGGTRPRSMKCSKGETQKIGYNALVTRLKQNDRKVEGIRET